MMESDAGVVGDTPTTDISQLEVGDHAGPPATGEVESNVKALSDVSSIPQSPSLGQEAGKTNGGGFAAMHPPASKPKGFAPPPPKFPGTAAGGANAQTAPVQTAQAYFKPGMSNKCPASGVWTNSLC